MKTRSRLTIGGASPLQIGSHTKKDFAISDSNWRIPQLAFDTPHTIEGVTLSMCVQGTATGRVNMKEYEFTPNTLVTILPDCLIEPIKKSEDLELEVLSFSFDFISDLPLYADLNVWDKILAQPVLKVSPLEMKTLQKYHQFILEQHNKTEHLFRKEIRKSLLLAMIAEVASLYSMREEKNPHVSKVDRLTNDFFNLLYKNHRQEREIQFYAEKMCLSPKYLTSTIKRLTGKSVIEWANEATIIYAKSLLRSTNMTVLQISEELNYSDSSVFCRFFKRMTNITPKQYRDKGRMR